MIADERGASMLRNGEQWVDQDAHPRGGEKSYFLETVIGVGYKYRGASTNGIDTSFDSKKAKKRDASISERVSEDSTIKLIARTES